MFIFNFKSSPSDLKVRPDRENKEIPKTTALNRIKSGKDVVIGQPKSPKRQRSSRFHVTEHVELEKLPGFKDVMPTERQDLFFKKLKQCCVIFDFSDLTSDLKGKEIKRQALTELVEYVTLNRGCITENVYPEIIQMVFLFS